VEVAALDDTEPTKMIPDAIEWQLSRMLEGVLDPCEEATAKLEHGSGLTRFHRGRAWLMKRALLARYKDDCDEFWCPPKGDVRGAERKTKGTMEKFQAAPEPIKPSKCAA
jgi:hypothetical protein